VMGTCPIVSMRMFWISMLRIPYSRHTRLALQSVQNVGRKVWWDFYTTLLCV